MKPIKPKVIIQPKSIIGFIPLKTKDRKAQIVVKTQCKELEASFFYLLLIQLHFL